MRTMNVGANGCALYENGLCGVYAVRPLDCRLFPFDIIQKPSGQLVLIAYTALCPVVFDTETFMEQATRLIPKLGENLVAYARAKTPGMDKEPYIELADLAADGSILQTA